MFRRRRPSDEFRAEVEAHIGEEIDRLRESGLSDAEARVAARRAFGNVTHAQERFYESHRWIWWDQLWQDVRYAARVLRKSPGFTVVAVLTIALGVGATTAIFSVVDATLLHPLAYPAADQLVSIVDDLPGVPDHDVGMSTPEWWDMQRSGVFEYVSPSWYDDNNLTGSARPARVKLLSVATNYFALLGVKPQLGSTFDPKDASPGFNLQVVISDGLWRRAFGADPHVVGSTVRLDTDPYKIIGVMPASFRAPGRTPDERNAEVWAAAGFAITPFAYPVTRSSHFPAAIARLKPGITLASAQSRIDALVASLQKQFPADYPAASRWTVRLVPLQQTVVGNVRQSLFLLFGAVGLVLLIACVNVANLLLARASARGREMALRQSLGAASGRLVRQLLTESVILSFIGGAAGFAVLLGTRGSLLRLVPEGLPRLDEISISWGVALFAFGSSLIAGALFGLAPALYARRLDLTHALREDGRGSSGSRGQARTRRALVVAEVALAMVLMVSASLLLRSFGDLLKVPLGFNPQNAMAVKIRLPYPNDPRLDVYGTVSQQTSFVHELLRRARALPGVEEVAFGNTAAIPLGHNQRDQNQNLLPVIIEGRDSDSSQVPFIGASFVSPEYFHLMGMALVRGRALTEFDDEHAPLVAVINQAMAQRYWPGTDPIGKRLKMTAVPPAWSTVVGVVADVRTETLEDDHVPQIYSSVYQGGSKHPPKHLAIFLRGHLDTGTIPDAVRALVQAVDPTIPVFGAQTLGETVSASLAQRRFSMQMVAMFALTALLLAAIGIYGVISYIVGERTQEIGIRLALGADKRGILLAIVRDGLGLALSGAAIGMAGAMVASHLMTGMLYGVHPTDPPVLAGVAGLLIGVALLACYIPARRVTDLDPTIALRAK